MLALSFTAGHVRDFLPQCRLSSYFSQAFSHVYRKLVVFSGRRMGQYRHYFVVVPKRVQNIFSGACGGLRLRFGADLTPWPWPALVCGTVVDTP